MTTFSQLVDDIARETHRPDMIPDIADYLNQTLREIHFTPARGNVIHFRENLREAQLVANTVSGFGWDIPNPALFQSMQAVRFDSIFLADGKNPYAIEHIPSRVMATHPYFFYRAGGRYIFSGYGGLNSIISLAYYEYPRRLKYRSPLERLASYDDELGWTYHADWDSDEAVRLDARTLSSNWILLRWRDLIAEGLRAKVYKRVSDDARARTSYSMYTQQRQGIFTSEIASGGGLT